MHRVMVKGAVLGFIVPAMATALMIDVPDLLILHFNHSQIAGRIIRVIPNSHGLIQIAYSVGGTEYERNVPSDWVPRLDTRRKPLRVYYNPHNPSIAAAIPADEILSGQLPP